MKAALLAAVAAAVAVAPAAAFVPNDPLTPRQWHLASTRAFDSWAEPPPLAPVKVAIIDSGIDGDHPEFRGRIAEAESFVGGSALRDEHGHGTFVAGLVAANLNNAQGIAGIAFPARLLVARVVRPGRRTITLDAEVRAIRWAADRGADVINLSLGGLRDPLNPRRDTFSPREAAAVAYAYRKGAVVVAAVGNADIAPSRPWSYAAYPAALPHVIGVSALARDGSVPSFSVRDKIFNDLAAPGQALLSTLPRSLTAARPTCPDQGYSPCGPPEFRRAEGTSFAAPQVTAAVALVRAVRPELEPSQVMRIVTRSASDVTPAAGCRLCRIGRDALSGWGRLDVAAAVAASTTARVLPADRFETNDDAGGKARRIYGPRGRSLTATIDFWDDQTDVYAVRLRPRQRLDATLRGPSGARLFLWRPGTPTVESMVPAVRRHEVARSAPRGGAQRLAYRVRRDGWHFVQVKITRPGAGAYTLDFTKR